MCRIYFASRLLPKRRLFWYIVRYVKMSVLHFYYISNYHNNEFPCHISIPLFPVTCDVPVPTSQPSTQPSIQPSPQPSYHPNGRPTSQPSGQPFTIPSCKPTIEPTQQPSSRPVPYPTSIPSIQPTRKVPFFPIATVIQCDTF